MIAYKKKQLKQLTENFMEVNGKKHTNKNGTVLVTYIWGIGSLELLWAAQKCSLFTPCC